MQFTWEGVLGGRDPEAGAGAEVGSREGGQGGAGAGGTVAGEAGGPEGAGVWCKLWPWPPRCQFLI